MLDLTKYVLGKVNLVMAGCPGDLEKTTGNMALNAGAIVIDKNRRKLGYIEATGYYPPAVVVYGCQRRARLLQEGVIASWAWVEKGVVDLPSERQIKASELLTKLQECLCSRAYGPGRAPLPGMAWPTITAVYPLEGKLTYEARGQKYSQGWEISSLERSVGLVGPGMALRANGSLVGPLMSGNREVMPRVETGVRYAYAPMRGNEQSSSRGALNSELMTQVVRNWGNITEAVAMYLDAVKHGLHKPMKPAFYPVTLSDDGKISAALVEQKVDLFEFARWSADAQEQKTKSHGGTDVPMSKHAYVGNPDDTSTWHLPIDTPGRAQNALSRVNQTKGIPDSAKPKVLQKIRRAASHKGVDVSEKPTSGQRQWAH